MGEKTKWKGSRKKCREINKSTRSRSNYKKTKTQIKKMFKTKKAVKCSKILSTMALSPHFIGCFSQDSLSKLDLCYPCFLMVNIDSIGQKGSHWLALKLDKDSLEIFDPLGFEIFNWNSIPCQLLEFIHFHSIDKKLLISQRIQSDLSIYCAHYCCFFIFFRNFNSFKRLCSLFSLNLNENDERLKLLLDV